MTYTISLACAKGTSQLCEIEAQELGLTDIKTTPTLVRGQGDLSCIYRLCLWTRTASRVLVELAYAGVQNVDDIYNVAKEIEWDDTFSPDCTFLVRFSGTGAGIRDTQFGALIIKDAIVDRFREADLERPNVDKESPDLKIDAHLHRDSLTIALDVSGSIHQRGYRTAHGIAPIRENLAATMIMRSGWVGESALVDPVCGSGTLLIEAGLIAADIAPALNRPNFGFEHWFDNIPTQWDTILDEAKARAIKGLEKLTVPIVGFESDERTQQYAHENIERAGLAGKIVVNHGELSQFFYQSDWGEAGMLACNPPYGVRLGESQNIGALYDKLGQSFKTFPDGWRMAVISGLAEAPRHLHLRAEKTYSLPNGPIDSKVYLFSREAKLANSKISTKITDTDNVDSVKITDSTDSVAEQKSPVLDAKADMKIDEKVNQVDEKVAEKEIVLEGEVLMFVNRLKKNLKTMSKIIKKRDIYAYRLYDADIPEYGLAVDVYDDIDRGIFLHVQIYDAPMSISESDANRRNNDALSALSVIMDTPRHKIFVKKRERQKGAAQYDRQTKKVQIQAEIHSESQSKRGHLRVREGLGVLSVNLADYLDTGLFLDHRLMRERFARESNGKRVMNLFCYTSSIGVHSALGCGEGGAVSTTNVDLSQNYLDWSKRNYHLNGIAGIDEKHLFIKADVMDWIENDSGTYDVIFCDPPTFSNTKKTGRVFDVQTAHVDLIEYCMARLANDGVLYFSNNFRKFKLDEAVEAKFTVRLLNDTIDFDYKRRANIHRVWMVKHT